MWTWWVRRSSSAPVRRSEPKTSVHLSKGRLLVTRMEPRSTPLAGIAKVYRPAREGKTGFSSHSFSYGRNEFTAMAVNRAVSSHGDLVGLTRTGAPGSAIMRRGRWYSSTMAAKYTRASPPGGWRMLRGAQRTRGLASCAPRREFI